MIDYERRFTSPNNSTWDIWEIYPDGTERKIDEAQDIYQWWRAGGGVARDVAYVAPPPPPPPAVPEMIDPIRAILAAVLDGDTLEAERLRSQLGGA
ncbi:MAG: hypothetical protein ABFD89_28375 [Bryobacteraceae bacterium]